MTLQLEEGKYYRSAAGEKVGPMQVFKWYPEKWIVNEGDGRCWFINGQWANLHVKGLSLVAEWVDEPAPAKMAPYAAQAYPDDNPKTAVGLTKPGTAAIPPVAIIQLGLALTDGERKYGRFNWRGKTVTTSVYTDAIDRHMLAFRDGEDYAADSQILHLAHVMACCSILIDALSIGKLNDDRRSDGKASELISSLTKKSA